MKTVDFSVYVHITGIVEVEEAPDSPGDLLDTILPNGWEGEVTGVCTSPQFLPTGYMDVQDDGSDEAE